MLRSWTRFLSVEPEIRAGIAIGRNAVCAVLLDRCDSGHVLRGIYRFELAAPILSGAVPSGTEFALTEALHKVSQEFKDAYAAVHVALPDTVVRSAVFELDELPKTRKLREALLRWRFGAEWQRPEEGLECRGVDLGARSGKKLFFGQAADKAWVESVRSALSKAGISPWSLNAAASYRFNRFHDRFTAAGAMLSLDPDSWSLMFWDEGGQMRRVLTRLRESGVAEGEMHSIAREAERMIMAYVQKEGMVDGLYLTGDGAEMAMLGAAFDGRLRETAIFLQMHEGVTGVDEGIKEGMAQLALSAALGAWE